MLTKQQRAELAVGFMAGVILFQILSLYDLGVRSGFQLAIVGDADRRASEALGG